MLYIIVDVIGFKYLVIKFICVKFEFLVEDLVKNLFELFKKVLVDLDFFVGDINDIILVGG